MNPTVGEVYVLFHRFHIDLFVKQAHSRQMRETEFWDKLIFLSLEGWCFLLNPGVIISGEQKKSRCCFKIPMFLKRNSEMTVTRH